MGIPCIQRQYTSLPMISQRHSVYLRLSNLNLNTPLKKSEAQGKYQIKSIDFGHINYRIVPGSFIVKPTAHCFLFTHSSADRWLIGVNSKFTIMP